MIFPDKPSVHVHSGPAGHPLLDWAHSVQADGDWEVLWYRYIECGGGAGLVEFDAYLHGALTVPPFEALALDQTAWEIRRFGGSESP